MRGNGERIGPQNLPTSSIAGGIWNLLNQQRAQQRGAWPSATPAVVTDPYFMYVPLLLNTTSTNGQQNNTFLDSSTNNFTITRNGTPTQGAFTPYQPSGYWSGYFGTAGDSISVPTSTALQFGTGAFCIELFFNTTTNTQYACLVSNEVGAAGFTILINNTASAGDIAIYNGSAGLILSTATRYNDGAWHHLVYCRDGTSARLYIDGVLKSTNTGQNTFAMDAGSSWYFSNNNVYAGRQLLGNMSNIRVVKGAAVYSGSTITVPTTPLTAITNTSLLTLQSNRFIDNSTNAFAITANGTPKVQAFQPFSPAASYSAATYGGSGYFNGSASDYLNVGSAATDYFGSGDFTLEAWVYKTTTATGTVAGKWNGTGFGWNLYTPSNAFAWVVAGGSSGMTGTITIPLFAWTHVVVSRSGSNWALFVNGVRDKTASTTTAPYNNTTQVLQIGIFESASAPFPGFISNLRIVKGTAVYDPTLTTLTVPTAPVTAITNTFLLTNFTNAGIYDAAWQNNALTVGDAQASTTQYKWSPTSMKFDGTGDYLTIPSNQSLALGTGNFTIEFWAYWAGGAFSNYYFAFDSRSGNSPFTDGVGIATNITNGYWYISFSGQELLTSIAATAGWQYIALVRNNGVFTLYVNGTSGGTYTATNNMTNTTALVGTYYAKSQFYWNGYIQDLRITKGVARTITTPTAAFPTR
jgi:hypothetical protein